MFAVQYFQRRDFVECYMMDESDEAQRMAEAAKECINRTLNRKDLYYFQKLTRARMIARPAGSVYLVCRWEEKYLPIKETRRKTVPIMDDMGTPIAMDVREEEVEIESKEIDHFKFEVFDPRNVFTDDTFTYSANQKPWITLRTKRHMTN